MHTPSSSTIDDSEFDFIEEDQDFIATEDADDDLADDDTDELSVKERSPKQHKKKCHSIRQKIENELEKQRLMRETDYLFNEWD